MADATEPSYRTIFFRLLGFLRPYRVSMTVSILLAIGSQAAAQYRSSGVSDTLELTLSASPDTYLDKVSGESEIASQEAEQLKTLKADQAQLAQEQALAAQLTKQQQAALNSAQAAKIESDALVKEAKALVDSLTPLEQQQMNIGSGGMWTHYSGTLPVPTGRAAIAVAYAESKLGDEYVTGGNGPDVFDCSGLVQQAWKAAGVSIPRTSFEMWDALPHISKSQLQPGDLVYFLESGASPSDGPGHVTMYIGNGMMIQATHPGSTVQWSSLKIDGYPFRLRVTVIGPQLGDSAGWGLSATRLEARAYAYAPDSWIFAAPEGLIVTRPGQGQITVSGKAIRASVGGLGSAQPRFSFEGDALTLTPAPGASPSR